MEGAVKRDRQQAAPFVECHVDECGFLADRGVEHEDIDFAETLDDVRHHRVHRTGIRNVGHEDPGLTAGGADFLHYRFGILFRGAGIDGHRGAGFRQCDGDGAADVACSAGDQRDFSCELPACSHA